MVRKVFMLMAIVLFFSACEVQADHISSTWIGGEQGYWSDANNWQPPIVPNSLTSPHTFDVTFFSLSANYWIIIDKEEILIDYLFTMSPYIHIEPEHEDMNVVLNIDVLENHGWLALENVGLTSTTVRNTGPGYLDLEDMHVYGRIENSGEMWAEDVKLSGLLSNSATMYLKEFKHDEEDDWLENWGEIIVHGDAQVGIMYNHGSITITSSGPDEAWGSLVNRSQIILQVDSVYNHYGGNITITRSGQVEAWGDLYNEGQIILQNSVCRILSNCESLGIIRGSGEIHIGNYIHNYGQVRAEYGPLILYCQMDISNEGILTNLPFSALHIAQTQRVENGGIIRASAGGGIHSTAQLNNGFLGRIELLNGHLAFSTVLQEPGAVFQGFGSITGNIVIEPEGLIELTGPTHIVGDVQLGANARVEISDGTTLSTGQTTCNGTIHMKGGRIIPQGGLSGNCNIIWEPGLYTNLADFNLDGKVSFEDFAYFADVWLWQAML